MRRTTKIAAILAVTLSAGLAGIAYAQQKVMTLIQIILYDFMQWIGFRPVRQDSREAARGESQSAKQDVMRCEHRSY